MKISWINNYSVLIKDPKINQVMTSTKIDLTSDEALVLFEFLSRFSDKDQLEIVDQAEERVLWNLTNILESTIPEAFKPDYLDLLEAARARLRDDI